MDVIGRLRDSGYRLTRQREVVLGVLEDHPGIPLNPADVHREAVKKQPEIGLATLYRTLELFSELGIALRVHLHGDAQYYELNSGGHHHHLRKHGNRDSEGIESPSSRRYRAGRYPRKPGGITGREPALCTTGSDYP